MDVSKIKKIARSFKENWRLQWGLETAEYFTAAAAIVVVKME